jgi:hypothetical protein
VFLPIIAVVSGLTNIAGLVGSTSPAIGVMVHLFSSGLIGISYGLLFERESPSREENLGHAVYLLLRTAHLISPGQFAGAFVGLSNRP